MAGGVVGLALAGAVGYVIAHQAGGVGHGVTRVADSSHAGFHGGGGQGGQAPMREPALPDIGGGYAPNLGAGTSLGGANAGSGAGAGASGSAGVTAKGAGFQTGAQGFPGGAQGFQGGAQGFQGGAPGFQGGAQGFQGDAQGFQGGVHGFQGGAQGLQGGVQGSQGGFHGAGVGEDPFTPEMQMPWGGGGFNPAYVGAGAGAVAAAGYHRGQHQEASPPGEPFQPPQSISYGPHVVAAATAGARRPRSGDGTSPPDWHMPTPDETSGGTGTSLPYARDGSGPPLPIILMPDGILGPLQRDGMVRLKSNSENMMNEMI